GTIMLLAVVTWVLFGDPEILRGHTVGILMGIASGAAMLPYTVIKEANPPELAGTATGVINFINFTFSALLGPVFGARLVEMLKAIPLSAWRIIRLALDRCFTGSRSR